MKSKIGIVIQREYLNRVRKKSFLLLTFLMPVLFAALVFVPLWLAQIKDSKEKVVVVIDQTGKYLPVLKKGESGYIFKNADKELEEYRKKSDDAIYATLVITDDLLKNPAAITLYSSKQITPDLSRSINQTLDNYLHDEKLASYNIPNLKEILNESKVSIKMQTIKWDEDGKEEVSSAELASVLGMTLTMIIYIFILAYGGMVMQGVLEEKTNRILEVMVSSVKPFDLMVGKIIGVGLVGLTQFFLWVIIITIFSFVGISFFGEVPSNTDMMMAGSQQDPEMMRKALGMISSINMIEILFYFLIYFIGGYMLYASLFAAIGSAVDSQEDTQQFMMPIMVLIIFGIYAGMYSMHNPDGPLAFWASMIPITSPIVMMVRLPFDIPLWEKLLSIFILYATFILVVKFSAKIYRVGILMYGKKPSIKELIKWVKYKA